MIINSEFYSAAIELLLINHFGLHPAYTCIDSWIPKAMNEGIPPHQLVNTLATQYQLKRVDIGNNGSGLTKSQTIRALSVITTTSTPNVLAAIEQYQEFNFGMGEKSQ